MWYYVENGQQQGPVTEADFQGLQRTGKITGDTLVWREGMAEWLPLTQVAGGGVATATAPNPAVSEVVCSECGKIFPANEVIRYGAKAVCAGCKPIFVQKLREGVNVSATMDYAGWWTRFAAYFLDGIITGVAGAIVGAVIGGVIGGIAGASGGGRLTRETILTIQFVSMGLNFILGVSYHVFFVGKFGATPGKMLCKIRIVNADGSKVSYAKALGRYFGYFVSGIICSIGFLMASWDDEHRALHDRMCNTRVIKA
jgi:uncharacterized RDD family membrane protein YckC